MTKIAILGKTGMLGNTVLEKFSKTDFEIIATTRNELDAQKSDEKVIENILQGCDYAINCIGIIKPYIHDENSFEVKRAIEVNALFPHKLAAVSKITGTKVIQIATDCVYDGQNGLYDENSKHNATDVYGKTKSLGEVQQENFLNLRCSIIGREKKSYLSLLEWFLNQKQNAEVKGFKNHLWNGVTTDAFADICLGIIKNNIFFSGTQHIVPADIVSKYQMLKIFADVFDRQDIKITEVNTEIKIDRTLSTINKEKNTKIWHATHYKATPKIEDMIRNILATAHSCRNIN